MGNRIGLGLLLFGGSFMVMFLEMIIF